MNENKQQEEHFVASDNKQSDIVVSHSCTPEQKAAQLIEKFETLVVMWAGDVATSNQNVKQCALICVEEILLDKKVGYSKDIIEERRFWQKVKEAIETPSSSNNNQL